MKVTHMKGVPCTCCFWGEDFWGKKANRKDLTSDKIPAFFSVFKAI